MAPSLGPPARVVSLLFSRPLPLTCLGEVGREASGKTGFGLSLAHHSVLSFSGFFFFLNHYCN